MTNEQRKAIELLERIHVSYFLSGMIEQSNYIVDKAYEADKAIDTVLSLIKEQEKQIDLMAENIELQQYANIDTSNLDLVCEKLKCNKKCELVKKDCIKQYFAGLVEKE